MYCYSTVLYHTIDGVSGCISITSLTLGRSVLLFSFSVMTFIDIGQARNGYAVHLICMQYSAVLYCTVLYYPRDHQAAGAGKYGT
jgi:hypothetical protein